MISWFKALASPSYSLDVVTPEKVLFFINSPKSRYEWPFAGMIENRLSSGACTLFDNCALRPGWSGMSEPARSGAAFEVEFFSGGE